VKRPSHWLCPHTFLPTCTLTILALLTTRHQVLNSAPPEVRNYWPTMTKITCFRNIKDKEKPALVNKRTTPWFGTSFTTSGQEMESALFLQLQVLSTR